MPIENMSRVYAEQFARRAAARGTGKDFRVLDAGTEGKNYQVVCRKQ